ncbi:MAG: DCC1-like thiol-disulfide oxidoreductase family protein [Pelagibaca sp.]
MTHGVTILYDGQCPFCTSYVSMMRLRETVGPVELVDARSKDPRVANAVSAGLDLDEGMVVIWDGRQFHGTDSVHLLATLSAPGGLLNNLQRRLFASPRRASVIYPALARGRRLFLRVAGRKPIATARKFPLSEE